MTNTKSKKHLILILHVMKYKFSSNQSLLLFLPKYFCEVGVWPDDSNTEYISPVVSLFNTITLVFFIR